MSSNDDSLSSLSTKTVIDADGKKLGWIKDAVVNLDTFQIRGFVIYGSRIEELLEDMGVRKDVDPFLTMKEIKDKTESTVTLTKGAGDLANVMEPGFLSDNELLFSKMRKMAVIDSKGQKLGIFTDIFLKGEEAVFQIGGKEFLEYLQKNRWTQNLTYLIEPSHISFDKDQAQFKIDTDLKHIERDLKLNMTNVLRELMLEAKRDGKVTKDEEALIDSVAIDLATYHDALIQALEDHVIDKEEERHLEELKETILSKVYYIARLDEVITTDEKALIEKLAAYIIERRKELLWKVFGTTT